MSNIILVNQAKVFLQRIISEASAKPEGLTFEQKVAASVLLAYDRLNELAVNLVAKLRQPVERCEECDAVAVEYVDLRGGRRFSCENHIWTGDSGREGAERTTLGGLMDAIGDLTKGHDVPPTVEQFLEDRGRIWGALCLDENAPVEMVLGKIQALLARPRGDQEADALGRRECYEKGRMEAWSEALAIANGLYAAKENIASEIEEELEEMRVAMEAKTERLRIERGRAKAAEAVATAISAAIEKERPT